MSRRTAALAAHVALLLAAAGVHFVLANGPAQADPTVGFVQSFTAAGELGGFASQATITNPGTGGVGGAGDGYLHIARPSFAGQLGARSEAAEYLGDWWGAGAGELRLSLKDVGGDQNLEIHVSIGNVSNFWQYDPAFIPPNGAWAEFVVDLTDTTSFTHIIDFEGGTSFAAAIATVDRILIRHDKPPFFQSPDAILGDFGVDEIRIERGLVGVPGPGPVAARRPVVLAPPAPNPSRGSAAFSFEAFDDGPVTIAIVDVRGRSVRHVRLAGGTPGRRTWLWDGRDDAGRITPAGNYRVRVFTDAGGMSRSLVRVL
jgi:hypothetical protein